jgi:DNA modification methylase
MTAFRIVYKNPNQLRPRANNPRIHSRRQIKKIADSIRQFGFVHAVLIDATEGIVAGHGRVEAAKTLGLTEIPTVQVGHLSPENIRAYVIADNRLAELAGWNRNLLTVELQELSVNQNFDATVTGFDTADIDIMISASSETALDPVDEVPVIDRTQTPVSRQGDLWQIGRHRLLCSSALDTTAYQHPLGSSKAQLVFTDPPYNVRIKQVTRRKDKSREFVMASGEMRRDEYRAFLSTAFVNLCHASADGSIHFIAIDWRHLQDVLDVADGIYTELKNICVWAKSNAGMGSFYRSQHELLCAFKNGTGPHINNIELGRFGRNRSNVWHYAGASSFGGHRNIDLDHPTIKPLALVTDAIMDCSKRNGIVLDSFAGSGTTLVAAEQTGRIGYGIELDPHYVDAVIKRMEEACGLAPVLAETGEQFATISQRRRRS